MFNHKRKTLKRRHIKQIVIDNCTNGYECGKVLISQQIDANCNDKINVQMKCLRSFAFHAIVYISPKQLIKYTFKLHNR